MDERARKLLIAGVAAALFVGFIFFTRWTGDDPGSVESLGDQETSDLQNFCYVINSGFLSYDSVLLSAAGIASTDSELPINSGPTRSLAESFLTQLVDGLPEDYSDNGAIVVEGLERALDGDLDADEVDKYLTAFDEMQDDAAEDCAAVGVSDFGDEGFGRGP